MKKSLFWLLALVLSPVAVLVVITPMDSQKQYIFGLLSIGILFLMGFSKRRSVSVIMVVTSLLMSTRYMYFRLTQTCTSTRPLKLFSAWDSFWRKSISG